MVRQKDYPLPFKYFHSLIFILLLGSLMACSTEDDVPFIEPPPDETPPYFIEVTDQCLWDRASFAGALGSDNSDPLLSLLPDREIKVESILYRTEEPTGERVNASGIIAYPPDGTFKGIVLGGHYSIGANDEAPSSTMSSIESALAFLGYLVIMPDYLGFGATRELPQTYLHAESAGRVCADMLFAVREYLDSTGMNIDTRPVSVVGYSQGAFTALAFTRMAEENYAGSISVEQVFAGGGPYEPASMFDLFIREDEIASPSTVLLTVTGLDYAERLGLDYGNVFREPLLSNYKEWCVSKKYTLGQINSLLGTNKLSGFMHPDLFTPSMNADLRKIMSALERNDLTRWYPKASVLLVHGTKDHTVPYINAENAYSSFKAAGTSVTLIPVNADHSETAISFYLLVLMRLI